MSGWNLPLLLESRRARLKIFGTWQDLLGRQVFSNIARSSSVLWDFKLASAQALKAKAIFIPCSEMTTFLEERNAQWRNMTQCEMLRRTGAGMVMSPSFRNLILPVKNLTATLLLILPPSVFQNRDVHAIDGVFVFPSLTSSYVETPIWIVMVWGGASEKKLGHENRSPKDRIIALIKETPENFLCFLSHEDSSKLAAYNPEKSPYQRLSMLAFQSVWPGQVGDMDFCSTADPQAIKLC